jgi:hypothetical protein
MRPEFQVSIDRRMMDPENLTLATVCRIQHWHITILVGTSLQFVNLRRRSAPLCLIFSHCEDIRKLILYISDYSNPSRYPERNSICDYVMKPFHELPNLRSNALQVSSSQFP